MGTHSGTMVALYVPSGIAEKVALPDGEPPASMHITLEYLGKELTPEQISLGRQIVKRAARGIPPVRVKLGGIGRFSASPTSDGRDVVYLSVDSPDITNLHRNLTDLFAIVPQPPKIHGFTPHVTLAYIDPRNTLPISRLEPLSFEVGALSYCVGDSREDIPVGLSKREGEVAETVSDLRCVFGENFPTTGYGATTGPVQKPVISLPFRSAISDRVWKEAKKVIAKDPDAFANEVLRRALDACGTTSDLLASEDVRLLELAIGWALNGPSVSD